jgi:hypothetical protein
MSAGAASRPAVFVQQLHRAAAQRGRLDPVYQDLSDHWTAILQRLYPVWALIGPGLSEPGHIEIHSRTVYLDPEALLGSRAEIAAGALERRAILRCFGVALHETMHAKHTKRWAIEHDIALSESADPAERQLAVDRRLLEEPRMEAHGVREFPPDTVRGRFVRTALTGAVMDVILPAFVTQVIELAAAGRPLTRDLAARATVYLHTRTRYGIVDPAVLEGLRDPWLAVLGDRDLDALDDLYARVVWIPDGELDRLDDAAREYRQIVGEPDEPPGPGGGGQLDEPGERGQAGDSRSGPGVDRRGGVGAGSLADALEQAIASARVDQLEQLDEDIELQNVLADAVAGGKQASQLGTGRGTGLPTDRMPDRGVDRPPYPDEVQHARRYANRLRQAITHGTRQIDKRTPGGRFDGRAYARGRAQQAAGRPVTSHPWRVVREVRAPIQEPHVGLIVDTSGSMGGYEYALGPIAWIITDALRQIGGRCATALFGNGVSLLADGSRPLPKVPGIRTGGGTAFAGARIDDDELRDAAAEDEQRRAQARARQAEATRRNLGLGHDIRAGLIQPNEAQLRALRDIICRLLARHHGELVAYGAGWTDPERQQPVGDTGRHEPRHPETIIAAELDRALTDPDPLRGIAQLTARLGAAFTLDPAGVTRTKALGTERMARKLRDALPGGENDPRAALWEFMRPMLSPALVELNRDAFVIEDAIKTTVDLGGRHDVSSFDDLDLEEADVEAA